MSASLGVVFRPQLPPEQLRRAARAADETGLEQLWLWEDCFRESGIAAAAAALALTDRLTVGVGLLPAPLRNVALTAMELATISGMFPGRFRVGIGHGVQDWMGQVGARVDSPLTLLREYVTALRSLLAGTCVTTAGRYVHLDRVALDWPPTMPPELLIGAVGAKTVALSGELADGTILTGGTPPQGVRDARTTLELAGASRAHAVVVYLIAASGADSASRVHRELQRWNLDAAGDVASNDLAVHGDSADIAASIRRWIRAGADTVVLQPTEDEPDLCEFIRFVAQDVRPLL